MEIDSTGQKTTGYVYSPAGGLLATQTVVSSTNVVTWLHVTPANSGEYTVNSSNSSVGRVEFDPLNAAISTTAPPTPPSLAGQGEVGPGHFSNVSARFGDIFNTTSGCYIDGIESTCAMATSLLNRGAGQRVMKAMYYNKAAKAIAWYGDVYSDGVAGFVFTQAMDGQSISSQIPSGQTGPTGQEYAPDTYGEFLGGWQNSFVNIFGGASYASTSEGFEPTSTQGQNPAPQLPQAKYDRCAKLLGKAAQPSKLATEAILWTSGQEGTDTTLIAVTWAKESGFDFNPTPNPREDGGYDMGPLQTSTTYFMKDRFVNSISEDSFAVNGPAVVGQRFTGDPYLALRWGARALNEGANYKKTRPGDVSARADMAGLYRAGSSRGGPYRSRVNQFNAMQPGYDAFFNCLKNP